MGNALGRSIKVDETTVKREIGYYASVLVEMDMSKYIPRKIWVESMYGSFEQRVHIPKVPKFCIHCQVVGHSVTECRSKKKNQDQVETETVVQTKKTWRKVKNKNKAGFDICFGEGGSTQNDSQILDSEDEIIDAIIPPITPGGGKTLIDNSQKVNEEVVNSGKFQVLRNIPEEILNSPTAFPDLSLSKTLDVTSSAPSINEVITLIPHLGKYGSNADSTQVKQKADRRELWIDMEEINSLNKPCLVIGDFSVVTSKYEKVGGLKPLRISMLEFNNCLNRCGLIQAPKTGLEFSCCNNRAGRKIIACNLDMVVFNNKWLEVYPSWGYKVSARGISDHGVLCGVNADIPKPKNVPFRALKVWKSHSSFKQVTIDSRNSEIIGNPGFIFMSKLKRLKKDIQLWNWNSFGDVTKKLKQAEKEVLKATLLSDRNPLDLNLLNNLVTSRGKQEILLDQQKEVTFATNIFRDIPIMVTNDDNTFLEATPKADEIREAVFELNPESAPGPDGFAGWFYREVWDIIRKDYKCNSVLVE
ncbi:uncharacterized protein LOC113305570 [Papaver somniferum]|uniref:uncharacterized protein LOC113305570 n=1 Tax=Papaver somniferum TaxID=3469 RepID=UPI000E70139D|nr:uncharacterized protein LOC113305570 [Papaver somniferum]